MKKNTSRTLILTFVICVLPIISFSLPLSTKDRWIIDEKSGQRVKLACVNWATHLQPMLAEGLDKRPLSDIISSFHKWGFNCVRLTYATHMFTRFADHNVAQTFDSLKLEQPKAGIAKNNPWALNMTHLQAFEAVVDELGKQGVMVVIDNHVSQPNWCCGETDGNGFFGDTEFHFEEWLKGLNFVSTHFGNKVQVVGVGLRNELRGARQNQHDWYNYMSKGAETVHQGNPNLLVVVGGLSYCTDLSFLKEQPLILNIGNKVVFEGHWYSYTGAPPKRWEVQPVNRICNNTMQWFENNNGYVITGPNPIPLFMSEFGGDQRGTNEPDNRFLTCLMAYSVARDIDWGIWALQGSYYLREGQVGHEETYGIFDVNWTNLRNPMIPTLYKLMQTPLQDANPAKPKYFILYHSLSGQCVQVNDKNELYMGGCENWSRWSQSGDGAPIKLIDRNPNLCLNVVSEGQPPILSDNCLSNQSSWRVVSNSKFHLAAMDKTEKLLCLEKNANSSQIFTKSCICIDNDSNCLQNPQIQWFQLIPTNLIRN